MNKPLKPEQLELVPDHVDAAVLTAAGLSPAQVAKVESLIADTVPNEGFDWNDANDQSIIVKPRPGIAVYRNKADDVVIRVQNTSDAYDDDHFAFIQPDCLPAVIKALKDELP